MRPYFNNLVLSVSGSLFYNYKGHFSIVLFALVDANYQFLFVDVGQPGSVSDASVWQESQLKQALETGSLNLPPPKLDIAYHFLGDDIFPLTTTLMKPFARGQCHKTFFVRNLRTFIIS